MAEVEITPGKWPEVQVGRVVLFQKGSAYENQVAVIIEIIDAGRVLVEGPSTEKGKGVPRQAVRLAEVALTKLTVEIPRGIRPGTLAAKLKESGFEKTWSETSFAKARDRSGKRKALSDFDRFKVMRLKKQVRGEVRKSLARVKAMS